MPMIDVTYPAGSLDRAAQAEVAEKLTSILIDIEGTTGITAIAAGTWLVLHEAPENTIAVGGKFAPGRYRIEIATPEDTLSVKQKEELIVRSTDALLRIAGIEPDAAQRGRVYCLLSEIPDGGWGFAGIAITKAFAAAQLRALKEAKG